MKAIYPLSADPVHKGHIYNIEAAIEMFGEVHVVIGVNGSKNYLFNVDERKSFLEKTISTYLPDSSHVTIGSFDGLMKNYALMNGYTHIVKGVRNEKDFDFENSLAKYHTQYGLQTILLPAKEELSNLSSTLVKEVVKLGGFVNEYVHPSVKEALEKKLGQKYLVAVTGSMGSGKTTFCKNLVNYANTHSTENNGIKFTHIDVDRVVKSIYSGNNPMHQKTRQEIIKNFGEEMFDENGINRKKAAEVIFNDSDKEKLWANILRKPLMIELEEIIRKSTGVVLLDAAYIVEKGMLPLTNYNVILVGCDEELRYKRIMDRDGLNKNETICRTKIQLSQNDRREKIIEEQKSINHGTLYDIDTTNEVDFSKIMKSLTDKL
ncbi:MAG: pantetheine-phosphate adenylyltransferase [Candidatus Woesearchaeota archaeon]